MRPTLAALALAAAAAAPAQAYTVYGGLALTSDYVFRGTTFTGNTPAVQGYVEGEWGGFYAGLWSSNVDFGTRDSHEVDLYFGYRGETAGGLSYDIGYARYYFDDAGDCCGEVLLTLGVPITDRLSATGFVAYDDSESDTAYSLTLEYALNDALTLAAVGGSDDASGADWFEIGATWSFSDTGSLDLRYHDTDIDNGILALTLAFDLELLSR